MAARLLVLLASFVLLLAVAVGYVRRAGVDADQFANRAEAALRDTSVRALIAERITDDVVLRRQADLIAARPLIESVAGGVVGSGAFRALFRAAVKDLHRALFDRSQSTLTLTVADAGTVVAAALETLKPSLADDVAVTGKVDLIRRRVGGTSADLAHAADTVKLLAPLLALAFLALAAAAIAISDDRRRSVIALGTGAALVGVLLVVGLDVARRLAVRAVDDGPQARAAARAVWDAFLGDLHRAGWVLAGAGAIVAAAADSALRPIEIGTPLERLGRAIAAEPERPALKALRGVALIVAGVVVLVARDTVVALLLTLAGVYLVWAGVTVLLRLTYRPGAATPKTRRRLAPILAVLLIGLLGGSFVATGGASAPAPVVRATGCNGHVELCDRTLPEVALAATHNSMSAPLPGWFASLQEGGIPDQLAFGIRGLLIDTHYGDRLPDGKVRTVLDSLKRQARADGVSDDQIAAALRIRARLGFQGRGKRGIYLCHSFCELGATPLPDVLRQLREFLVAHPSEVVVVVNQDEVTPEDFVAAVRDAGLEPLAYKGSTTDWPTLGEMVKTNQRVLFLAEAKAGGAPWYHLAYRAITQETPYAFQRPAQIEARASCDANRGPASAPLFLLNHWITTDPLPKPSLSRIVNARGVLLDRARECERLRGHVPNLIAVNFYREGDLLGVVDTLNGVR